MTWALIVVLASPLVAVGLTLIDGWRLARAATCLAGLACFGAAIALAISVEHGRIVHIGQWVRLDSLGAVFLVATGMLYAAAGVFSIGYLGSDQDQPDFARFARRYFALLNLFGWSMLLVPLAGDFGSLWVAVELTTILSALMVALDRTDAALEASWKYVLIASCGLGIALLAIILLYASGTNALGEAYVPHFESVLGAAGGLSDDAVRLSFVLAVVGFGTKVGFFPMHTWLPDAHSEAPAPVSALLSGSLLAAAFYAILRFFQVAVAAGDRAFAEHVLIVFGVVSLVAASLFVLRQGNYKRLLAYSSIEHMGVIALGVGFGAPLAVAGALLHVITHASAKGLAFFGSGSLLRRYDTKEVDGVTGAATGAPWTGPMFLAAAIALCGLPLSGVFRSEFQIVSGGFAEPAYVGVALLIVFVNVAFFGVLWHASRMVLTPAPEGTVPREVSAWMIAGMAGCLFVVVALGVHMPSDLTDLLTNAAHRLSDPTP
jgi:hydrogenase-4 component F